MARLSTKKELENFSNNLKKLSENLETITTNVDDINNQFDDYGDQINGIKDNVKSLENELKLFMQEVKVAPIIEKAKEQIKLNKQELEKKYAKHNIIREKLYNIINNINDGEISKDYLLTNEEQNNLNIPDFYLSFVLFSINNWINNNKKSSNKSIKQALKLNNEKTSLLLTLINHKLNRKDATLKWLNYYLNTINPNSTNDNIVKLIDYFKDDKELLNIILKRLDIWTKDLKNDDTNNEIFNYLDVAFKYDYDEEEKYPFSYAYCDEYYELMEEIQCTKIYKIIYNKLNSWLKYYNNYDLLYNLIYSYDGKEYDLKNDIYENEYIIKNNGKTKSFTKIENKNILYILLISLNNKKINKDTKLILLKYLKTYFINYINKFNYNVSNKELKLQIDNWVGFTKNGSNENELINEITDYLKKPVEEELSKMSYINYKTIYSLSFSTLGIILSFFYSSIGIPMLFIGLLMLGIIVYSTMNLKKEKRNQINEQIHIYKYELYNLLAEITDIKFLLSKNNNYKELILNYFYDLDEGDDNE